MIKDCISDQAETILQHRYYLKDNTGTPVEDSIGLFKRVAKAIAGTETQYDTLPADIEIIEDSFFEVTPFVSAVFCDSTFVNFFCNFSILLRFELLLLF